MIWQDKAFLAVYFLIIITVQCYWQKALFKRNMPISHFWHGVYYALTALPMMYFFMPVWWQVAVIAVVTRLALFGPVLNLVRGKRPILFYNGKGTTGSWQNKQENKLSDWVVKVLKIFYIIVFVVVIIIL